ncbi:glucosyltransferase domain-containing protein [Neobacillus sp. 3P2-tot-E-2]|uniref:glucosyltransferase domain-containing protein n=1 Tax=Neobacillus sp. 3P2-tot-E-2 TaxID=3132212 RepID=UPI0039A1648A
MKEFLVHEKNMFLDFFRNSKFLLGIISFFVILTYGIKIFYFDYSIDTEVIMDSYLEQMGNWLGVNRHGLVFTKFLLFNHRFNPFVANFLTFFTLTIVCFLLCYLVQRISNIHVKKTSIFILPILFLSHPIIAELLNFTLLNFEVSLAILFLVLSLLLSYYFVKTNYKTFAIMSIMLNIWSFLTYQSLISFYIAGTIVSILLILNNDQKEQQVKDFKRYFIIVLKYLLIFMISFILSQLLASVHKNIMGIANSTYLSRNILWGKLPFNEVVSIIYNQIKNVVLARSIFYNYGFLFSTIIVAVILIKKLRSVKSVYLEILGFMFLYLSPFLLTILLGQSEAVRAQMPALQLVIAFNFYYIYLHLDTKLLQRVWVLLCIILAFNQSYLTANLLFSEHVKYEEDVTLANRINIQLDSMGISDRKNYSLIILGKHEPENVINLKGETLGHSFFAWDMGTKQGTTIRAVVFMRTLGYPFQKPTDEQLNYAHSIKQEMTVWPDKNSIRIENDSIIIKLSEDTGYIGEK